MSTPAQGTPGPGSGAGTPTAPKPPRFMNGWTKEQENLMADWSDIAGSYRWMHDRCEKRYSGFNMSLTIPVIILSTLTGTANFAIDSFIPPNAEQEKKLVQAGIGAVSIFAGILTTLGNFLRFAQLSESHRVASISWGKLQRQIAVELRIHPNDRMDCLDFLKLSRAELDRLIEQSPAIPDVVIKHYEYEFKDMPKLKRPDIAHGMDRTEVFRDNASMLKKLAADAALVIKSKKKMLRDEILPDLDRRIKEATEERVKQRTQELEAMFQRRILDATQKARAIAEAAAAKMVDLTKKQEEEEQQKFNKTRLRPRYVGGAPDASTSASHRALLRRASLSIPSPFAHQSPPTLSPPSETPAPLETPGAVTSEQPPAVEVLSPAPPSPAPLTDSIGSLHASSFHVVRGDDGEPYFQLQIGTPSQLLDGETPVDETVDQKGNPYVSREEAERVYDEGSIGGSHQDESDASE
jgi:hypothetical protein